MECNSDISAVLRRGFGKLVITAGRGQAAVRFS